MENSTNLETIVTEVKVDMLKADPQVCPGCNCYSENIALFRIIIIYRHPELKGTKEDRVVNTWDVIRCRWCINQIIGEDKKPPPHIPLIYPQAS